VNEEAKQNILAYRKEVIRSLREWDNRVVVDVDKQLELKGELKAINKMMAILGIQIKKRPKNKVAVGYDYFPKDDDDSFWVHVYDVKEGVVYFNNSDADYTKGELTEDEFLKKYMNMPIDGTDERAFI
jgi:hypothetical protein